VSAPGVEGEHESGEAGEEQADADERADDPGRAERPGSPDNDGEDEVDDAVEEQPKGAVAGLQLEVVDDQQDSFDGEVGGEQEGERGEAGDGMEDEVDPGEEIKDGEQNLPEDAAGGVGLPGEEEVEDADDGEEPADDEGDGHSGDDGDDEGEEAGEGEQDGEGEGPAEGGSEAGSIESVVHDGPFVGVGIEWNHTVRCGELVEGRSTDS